MHVRYLGHSAWEVQNQGTTILIDPFLTGNPMAGAAADDLHADYILLTHAHADHLGDTVAIARRTGAVVITTDEVASLLAEQGCQVHPMHLGGVRRFPFGSVRVTLAFHGSGVAGGHPCGFVLEMDGKRLYHAGDTALFGDMQLIPRLAGPLDLALLPIGDNFTMGPEDALLAVEFLQPRLVAPMHCQTFPLIEVDVQAWANQLTALGFAVALPAPGETITVA